MKSTKILKLADKKRKPELKLQTEHAFDDESLYYPSSSSVDDKDFPFSARKFRPWLDNHNLLHFSFFNDSLTENDNYDPF